MDEVAAGETISEKPEECFEADASPPDLSWWLDYFRSNAAEPKEIPWEDSRPLASAERRAIAASIAAFQLGEYSEGRHLLAAARECAARLDEPFLVEITELFVKEEQRHALMLQRFMMAQDIPVLRKNWTNEVFRKLRKHVGFEHTITVLIVAEIIALPYYRALESATRSRVLRAVCRRILREETMHLRYESHWICYLRGRQSRRWRAASEALHRLLYTGTVLVVFWEHRSALRRGGSGLKRFWRSSWHEFNVCFTRTKGFVDGPVANRVPIRALNARAQPTTSPE